MNTKRMVMVCLYSGILLTAGLFAQTENLTHSWTFNDGTTNDYAGGLKGTLMGNASVTEGVLWISDLDQWMEMPADSIALNTYDEITLEIWFVTFPSVNDGYTMLTFFGDTLGGVGVDSYFISSARGDDKSRAAISIGVYTNPWSGENGADGIEFQDDDEMHHLVSTLTNDEITLYVDGVFSMATPLTGDNNIAGISDNVAFLAKSGYLDDPEWIGDINEFNIYNRALTEEEIAGLFDAGPSEGVTAVEHASGPSEYSLQQNFPNPFNPSTNIVFDLPVRSEVQLAVYDVQGREVARLADGMHAAGRHSVRFDGTGLNSGVYLCRMSYQGHESTRRMLLLK